MAEFDKKTEKKLLDDFWDIDKLVPKRKSGLNPFKTTDPVKSFEPDRAKEENTDAQREKNERSISFEGMRGISAGEVSVYEPCGSLIKRVTVKKYVDKYDFYEQFRKTALIYHGYKTEKCDFVQFYSYMPQYSQLSREQRSYYFYWRSETERGRYIKTDYSYLYLYVYEILNLPDKIPPEEGIKILCALWRQYRAALPRIDTYFSVWVQDYCLVHRLPCPTELIEDFIYEVVSSVSFKEFYLSDISTSGERGTGALLAFLSDYDWRCGKYSSGTKDGGKYGIVMTGEDYKRLLYGSLEPLLASVKEDIRRGTDDLCTAKTVRDAFPNLLCTRMVKSRLEIEYIPLMRLDGIRRSVSAAVRYAENRLRALMGVKSRIAVRDLPENFKEVIDGCFDVLMRIHSTKRQKAELPEYERFYDAPREKLSFEGADEIERASWGITARLVDEEELASANEPDRIIKEDTVELKRPENGEEKGSTEEENFPLSKEELELLRAALIGEVSDNLNNSAAAEVINEYFYDVVGDVVLEASDGVISIIEDYREDVENWLNKITS